MWVKIICRALQSPYFELMFVKTRNSADFDRIFPCALGLGQLKKDTLYFNNHNLLNSGYPLQCHFNFQEYNQQNDSFSSQLFFSTDRCMMSEEQADTRWTLDLKQCTVVNPKTVLVLN